MKRHRTLWEIGVFSTRLFRAGLVSVAVCSLLLLLLDYVPENVWPVLLAVVILFYAAGAILIVISCVIQIIKLRCPACGAWLGRTRSGSACCPDCGTEIDWHREAE